MTSTLDTAPAGQRVTPTGHLVLTSKAARPEWLEARRFGITATDIVKAVGSSKYGSVLDVYADKIGQPLVEDDLGEAGQWGQELEDYVARRWAELNAVRVRRVGLIANSTNPWMLASLDRLVTDCPNGRCAAEIKTRNAYKLDEWEQGVPDDVDVQVQWQLAVSGLDHVHVAVLIGGQRLIEHVVHPKPVLQEWLIGEGARLWSHVEARIAPPIDPALMSVDLLNRIYQERGGVAVVDGDLVRQLLVEYSESGEGEKSFKETKERIKVELLTLLGENEEAVDSHGVTLFTYKAQSTRKTDLKRLEAEHPDVYAEVVTSSVSRTFRPNAKAVRA